jgi:hypothetical protein
MRAQHVARARRRLGAAIARGRAVLLTSVADAAPAPGGARGARRRPSRTRSRFIDELAGAGLLHDAGSRRAPPPPSRDGAATVADGAPAPATGGSRPAVAPAPAHTDLVPVSYSRAQAFLWCPHRCARRARRVRVPALGL